MRLALYLRTVMYEIKQPIYDQFYKHNEAI